MEDMFNSLDKLDLTFEIEDLIYKEQDATYLMIVAHAVAERYVSPKMLMKVFQKVWAKQGGMEFTFLLYFDEQFGLDMVLSRVL